ncbi:MAG: hypothetical protein DSY80_03700 [Desulfocapsa sp.]|nr:MAG: hypothetical protein DSY80_03700 [Desulfocapsa sp.]
MIEMYTHHTLKPDFEEARRFLTILDPALFGIPRPFDFRTFDDVRNTDGSLRRNGLLNANHRGKLEDVFESLCGYQRGGAGVFFTANRMDGKGCLAKNVDYIRGVWIDDDNIRQAHRVDFPEKPTVIVESSPGKFHYYWIIRYQYPLEMNIFDGIMLRLAQDWGHDKGASGIARVMRLPGFYHCKGEPFMSRIVGGTGRQMDLYDLIQAFPPIEHSVSPLIDDETGEIKMPEDSILRAAAIGAAMSRIPAMYCDDRKTWLEIGMAINHEFGDAGFSMWDDWSQNSDKYDQKDSVKTWKGFAGKGIGDIKIGTLFYYSNGAGFWEQYPQPSQETIDAINRQFGRPPEGPEHDAWEAEQRKKVSKEQQADLKEHDAKLKPTLDAPIDRWDAGAPPAPVFLWGNIIPKKAVTLFVADGGTGKSLFGQMMMTCVGAGCDLLGIPIRKGAAIGIFGEDPDAILYERQQRIEAGLNISRDVLRGNLFIQELVEFDVTMWSNDEATLFFADIETSLIKRPDIELVIIDNSSISFDGNENSRRDVHHFLRALNRLASKHDASFVLLHHTSKSQGTDSYMSASGSTAWVNGARCVLRLCAETDGEDGRAMRVEHIKHNYSQKHEDIEVHWCDDIIKPIVGLRAAPEESVDDDGLTQHERVFIGCMMRAERLGLRLSASINSAKNYAPKIFVKFPEVDVTMVSITHLEKALHKLMDKGIIVEEEYENHRRKFRKIVLADKKGEDKNDE